MTGTISRAFAPARGARLVLPYPVSANRYWRSFVPRGGNRAITVLSQEAKAYKRAVSVLAKQTGVRLIADGAVEVIVLLVPANRVCIDLDNALKVLLDALQGVAYSDDAQVYRIVAERADPDPRGGARIEIDVVPMRVDTALEAAA